MTNILPLDKYACASIYKTESVCGSCRRNLDIQDITKYDYKINIAPVNNKCDSFLKESKFKIIKKGK